MTDGRPRAFWFALPLRHAAALALILAALIAVLGGLPSILGALVLAVFPALRFRQRRGWLDATIIAAMAGGIIAGLAFDAHILVIRLALGAASGVLVAVSLTSMAMLGHLSDSTRPPSA